MRSEKEVKARIEDFKETVAKGHLSPELVSKYNLVVTHLEWVLSEPKEAPLTPIELRELRAILAEQRAKRSDYGNPYYKPGGDSKYRTEFGTIEGSGGGGQSYRESGTQTGASSIGSRPEDRS